MTPLQWALLIFGVVAVVAVYLYSRRDRRAMDDWNPDEAREPLLPAGGKDRQLDIFNNGGGSGGSPQQYDEFGVGKPRRVAPSADGSGDEPDDEPAPRSVPPQRPIDISPGPRAAAPRAPAPSPAPSASLLSEKIVSLLIAEREGTAILGPILHDALESQGLEFGARQIYHRLHKGEPVFSVASLLKPGHLDPDAAEEFSTPGLTLFMVLPGPQKPLEAIKDMLGTAQALAKALNAEVYDSKRKPLTPGAARNLQLEVETWALGNKV